MKNNYSDWKKELFRKYLGIKQVLKIHRKLFNIFSHYLFFSFFLVPHKQFINTENTVHSQRKIQYSHLEVFMYIEYISTIRVT